MDLRTIAHSKQPIPGPVVIIDIDGLRRDVFQRALQAGDLPHFERILGGQDSRTACHIDAVSTAPSITFTAQASIVTGTHPAQHGIPGNESFDRFGRISGGRPRHFGFDVGDTLAVDDAVGVFRNGLASRFLREQTPTLYETLSRDAYAFHAYKSAVFYHMYARGAAYWRPPSVVDIARFTKGQGILGMEAGHYDAGMLHHVTRWMGTEEHPDVLMVYFMGLDHHSHVHGPAQQQPYLKDMIDPQVGLLLDTLDRHQMLAQTLFVIVSDHGQADGVPDDRHALQLGFPFDLELVHIFTALGLDVHDKPGEDPNCDAVMGLNGGLAHVYLQNRQGRWSDRPRYNQDVMPVAKAFHEMNKEGKYADELHDTLEMILIRDVEHEGWDAMYKVYQEGDKVVPLTDYLSRHSELEYVDPINRLAHSCSEVSGDLLLVSRGRDGYYFGAPIRGVHGGLLPGESDPVLTFALPGGDPSRITWMNETVQGTINDRTEAENNRQPSIADMVPALLQLLDVTPD